jgi:hypothetical protein
VNVVPWRKLGLAEPRVDAADAPMGFAITRPVYSHHGATTRFQYTVAAVAGAGGKKIPPFVEQEICSLEKGSNGWRLLRCKLTDIR